MCASTLLTNLFSCHRHWSLHRQSSNKRCYGTIYPIDRFPARAGGWCDSAAIARGRCHTSIYSADQSTHTCSIDRAIYPIAGVQRMAQSHGRAKVRMGLMGSYLLCTTGRARTWGDVHRPTGIHRTARIGIACNSGSRADHPSSGASGSKHRHHYPIRAHPSTIGAAHLFVESAGDRPAIGACERSYTKHDAMHRITWLGWWHYGTITAHYVRFAFRRVYGYCNYCVAVITASPWLARSAAISCHRRMPAHIGHNRMDAIRPHNVAIEHPAADYPAPAAYPAH